MASLIVYAEDEFDPIGQVGLMSLKALARVAGLGWQGRPLLIVSPEYSPLHRLIAVLTDMPLRADQPLANRCGNCSLYVDKCPRDALTLVPFEDHPARREDILDIELCLGDEGGKVCPWSHARGRTNAGDEKESSPEGKTLQGRSCFWAS